MKKLLTTVLAITLMACVVQATTLLHYDFSNGSGTTVTDLSGQGNHGTLTGFASTGAGVGQFGVSEGWVTGGGLSIMQGDANRSYVGTPLQLGTITGDWTIEYFANADDNVEWAPAVASSNHWSTGVYVGLNWTYNTVLVAGYTNYGGDFDVSPYTLPGDQSDPSIHHIAMVYDVATQTVECFVDGLSVGTTTPGGIPAITGATGEVFRIGNTGWSSGEQWDGVMYGVAISNTKLSLGSFVLFDLSSVAWSPYPQDGAANVPLGTDLKWNIPSDANEVSWTYDVYFDTDSTFALTTPITAGPLSAGGYRASVTNAQIGGPLDADTYFWRVDSVDPNVPYTPVTRTGEVWSFTAGCTLPTLIDPNNTYDEVVEIDVDLEWSSDPIAATHNVVITPDGGSAVTLTNKTSPFNPYADAGIVMEWNKQYTWQVIEKDSGGVTIADGPVWKFRVRALNCDVSMTADIDGSNDCVVDIADFAALASQWLDCKWDDGGKASPCP